MHVKLYNPTLDETLLSKEYPARYADEWYQVVEFETNLHSPIGHGFYKEIYFEGVHIGYGNAQLAKRAKFKFESDFESVEMHFALKGHTVARAHSFQQPIVFAANQHNIIYANQIQGDMRWELPDFELFEVNLDPSFFQRYLPKDIDIFDQFRNKLTNQRPSLLRQDNLLITHAMTQVIQQIIHCNRKGLFKKMFLEAKVIELLLLQLEQFDDIQPLHSFKKNDVDKIYAVKEFLSNNLDEQLSLIDMAHRFGTNEFTLKKGFKELFGTTVFGFWNDLKMTEAMRMLQDHDMLINEVADAVGYQNARHFSTAFARRFGMPPSHVKKAGYSNAHAIKT